MVLKNLCVLVLWTKVASALEGLRLIVTSHHLRGWNIFLLYSDHTHNGATSLFTLMITNMMMMVMMTTIMIMLMKMALLMRITTLTLNFSLHFRKDMVRMMMMMNMIML